MTKAFLQRSVRRFVLLAPCVAAAWACDRPSYTYSDDVPIKGTGASSGSGVISTAGTGVSSGGAAPVNPCAFSRTVSGTPVLASQVVSNSSTAFGEVYAELTDAESDALEHGGSLIPVPQQFAPVSALSTLLMQESNQPISDVRKQLVALLQSRFKVTRSTWPSPWALRLVDHAGTEHMNPVRIVFKPDALIVKLVDTTPVVVDVQNMAVLPAEAVQAPERIVGVFYTTDAYMPGLTN
ncbi:MAG TPA: hypothetical protein VNG33_14025, partial [Polyangiaceae bacterium]|nr:hypothetical protein [Polyangiaceae bacterium]